MRYGLNYFTYYLDKLQPKSLNKRLSIRKTAGCKLNSVKLSSSRVLKLVYKRDNTRWMFQVPLVGVKTVQLSSRTKRDIEFESQDTAWSPVIYYCTLPLIWMCRFESVVSWKQYLKLRRRCCPRVNGETSPSNTSRLSDNTEKVSAVLLE